MGQNKFAVGDTVFAVVVDTPHNSVPQATINASRYGIFARYVHNAAGTVVPGYDPTGAVGLRNKFPQVGKYTDSFRTSAADEAGTRDGILDRLGETYLIAAEAYGRKSNYATALQYVNVMHQRAACRAGEVHPNANYRYEGDTRGDVSSTYPDLIATQASFTTNNVKHLQTSVLCSTNERLIHFMLNERTRKLHCWEDLGVRAQEVPGPARSASCTAGKTWTAPKRWCCAPAPSTPTRPPSRPSTSCAPSHKRTWSASPATASP